MNLDSPNITDRQLIDALARRGYVVADGVIDIDYGASIDYGALQDDLAELERTDPDVAKAAADLHAVKREIIAAPWATAELAVHEILKAARTVIARWDADDVDDGLMNRDISRLRRACDTFGVNRGER